ncbi:MAG: hypothetical protein E6234_06275 [Sutterella wadsworthensis]|nr:hypothetical protein [Sutterella wadsworthensis]
MGKGKMTKEKAQQCLKALDEKDEVLRCYSASSIAKLLDITARTWRNWVQDGQAPLPLDKWKGQPRWRHTDLKKWLDAKSRSEQFMEQFNYGE